MKLYSTKDPYTLYSLQDAIFCGLPPDNGLFMPKRIPKLTDSFFDNIETLDFKEIAYKVSSLLLEGELEPATLEAMVDDVFSFEVPLVQVTESNYCLELYHGPTLAFKDFGARFMARLMGHYLKDQQAKPCILVATSGDTGSAVAQGFFQVPGIEVVILYPSGKVSEIQEKQLTTMGGNITTLEIDGTFDDCQRLVKAAFLDKELRRQRQLTSANSINIARLIPQSFYYFQIYARLQHLNRPIICSVPSGNFGNLTGGLMAKAMGLPISRFIAANNSNKVFYDYLSGGHYQPKPSIATISNAMDVGDPSNFARIQDLYHHNRTDLTRDVVGYTFTDEQTRAAIARVYQEQGYILDPHGAVGYLGLQEYYQVDPGTVGVFLGTAHPAKFLDVVQPLISGEVTIPPNLQQALNKKKVAIAMSSSFEDLKAYLLSA